MFDISLFISVLFLEKGRKQGKTLIHTKKVKFRAEMPKYFKFPPKMPNYFKFPPKMAKYFNFLPKMPKYFILVRKWQNMLKIFFML